MTIKKESNRTKGQDLCIFCGLCCTGHLFTFASLKDTEVPAALALGLTVDQENIPGKRYFALPCPRFDGKCSIYRDPGKPEKCTSYKCALLKKLKAKLINIEEAKKEIQDTKEMIREIEKFLPENSNPNFCIELLPYLDALEIAGIRCDSKAGQDILKVGMLLARYNLQFGITKQFKIRREWLSQD